MKNIDSVILSKLCRACGETKCSNEFSKRASSPTGLQTNCKKCSAEIYAKWHAEHKEQRTSALKEYRAINREKDMQRSARYRVENKDSIQRQRAEYRAENPDRVKEIAARYRKENKKKENARSKAYRDKNPDKHKAAVAAWRGSNRKVARVHEQNRRARRRDVGGRLSNGLSAKLFILQKGKCPCCGLPLGDDYHLDHKMPLALGGTNTDENMQLLRSICNLQKHAKHPVDFMQERGYLL